MRNGTGEISSRPISAAWRKAQWYLSLQEAEILEKLNKDYDDILAIPEEEILPACYELAAMGIYVEPTSAMVFAALKKSPVTHGKTVLVFSGNGLKYS